MGNKVRKIKSICGKYKLVYTGHVSRGYVIDENGREYKHEGKQGKNDAYYSTPHEMTGYAAYADGLDSRKFFTVRFAYLKNGVRIIPFSGNTILKEYSAIFRVQQ